MQFISRRSSPSFILQQGEQELNARGSVVKYVRPAVVRFSALIQPHHSELLPTKGKVARGRLDSKVAAEQLRRDGHTYMERDPTSGDMVDVTDRKIVEYLIGHRSYGIEFIALGDHGKEVLPSNGYLLKDGDDGQVYCTVCARHFNNAGAAETHAKTSREHLRLMDKKKREAGLLATA